MSEDRYLPVAGKKFGQVEIDAINAAAADMHWTSGRWAKTFSNSLAKVVDQRYSLLTNSGSSANLLAVSALTSPELKLEALRPGDRVLTVAAGFPTTIAPIFQNGLVPVFVDVDLDTYNIDTRFLDAALKMEPKAVIIAHTLGIPFDVEAILDFCLSNGLWLIEDNCDALGSEFSGQRTGSFGHMSTQSFYPAHHITTGEGGAVSTSDPRLKRIIESLRDWGRDCWCETGEDNTCGKRFKWKLGELPDGYDHKYIYSHLGYNMKMSDLHAAIGVVQLTRLDEFIAKRKINFGILDRILKSYRMDRYFYLPNVPMGRSPSWFGYPLTVRSHGKFSRFEIVSHLEQQRIGTRPIFAGNFTRQPAMSGREFLTIGSLRNTDIIMNSSFWVGVWPGLEKEDMVRIAKTIVNFVKERI